jgi:hypothetical protein
MLQPCEETTVGDIESCKALIADLRALFTKAELVAHRAGAELNDAADYIGGKVELALTMATMTLRTLEADGEADARASVVELRREELRVA